MHPTVLVVAVTYGILLRIAALAGLLGIPLRVLVLLSLWRYSYSVLQTAARGSRYLPPPGIETMNPVGQLSLVLHFLFFFLLIVLVVTTPFLGEGPLALPRWVALLAVLTAFPASAALMGVTRSLVAALNPASMATVIGVLGPTYWKLVAGCVALTVFNVGAEVVLDHGLLLVPADIISVWSVLAFFALTGAAIGQHRDDFEIPGEHEQRAARDERDRHGEWRKTLDRAYGSIRGGLVPQGYHTIKGLLASEGDSLEIHQWVFNQMAEWENKSHAVQLGERFVARLMAEDRKHNALELVQQCRRLTAKFSLPPETTTQLIAYARSVGRHRLADELEGPPPARAPVSPRAPTR